MSTVFVGDCDFRKVHFAPVVFKNGSPSVEVFADASAMTNKNKIKFNLCPDIDEPVEAPFPLDAAREDGGNPERRGMLVRLTDKRAIDKLAELDDAIVKAAVLNSTSWFKRALTETEVRARYKPIVAQKDDHDVMKFKVKCPGAQVPTTMHLRDADGVIRKNGVRLDDLMGKNKKLVPILSAYSLYFMAGGSSFGISFQAEEMMVTPGEEQDALAAFESIPFVGECDFGKVHFAPVVVKNGSPSVEVFADASAMTNKNKIKFNLCSGLDDPVEAPYTLDAPREDGGNPERRGMLVRLANRAAVDKFAELDDAIVKAAVLNSTAWFKRALTETEVRARYKPIVAQKDDHDVMKFKVKCGGAPVPTRLHLRDADGAVAKGGARLDHLLVKRAKLVPILSAYSLYFMAGGSSFGISFQAEEMVVTPGEEADELAAFASKKPMVVAPAEPAEEDVTLRGTGPIEVTLEGEATESAM